MCYSWYLGEKPISVKMLSKINSCPPYEQMILKQLGATWVKAENKNGNEFICYKWRFEFDTGIY